MVGEDIEIRLGEITADTDGIFLQNITIPVDLKEGVYYFLATTDDHKILSPALSVNGAPILDKGVGGQSSRDQGDGLLAPMLTAPVPPANSSAPTLPSTLPSDETGTPLLLSIIATMVVTVFGIIVFIT